MRIKKKFKNLKDAVKEVYKNPFYAILFIFVTLIFIAFNIGIVNYRLFLNFPSFKVAQAVFLGTFLTLPIHSIILLFISSIFIGLLISLLVYHIKSVKESESLTKTSSSGFVGMILGIIAPACASCGIGLVALLGFTGLIGALPFAGLEIGIAGIFLLGISIFSISAKITNKTCELRESYFSRIFRRIKNE
jgi:hypothetical protein